MATSAPFLIVPGYKGSGPDHWQTWLQTQVSDSTRVDGIDWDAPVLAQWAGRIRDVLAHAPQPVRIVAHSFGCLAAVVAAADRPDQVAQLILAAPADPARFDFAGLKPETGASSPYSLAAALPEQPLPVHGTLIASRNDPWLSFDKASALADFWGLDLLDIGPAGHINPESGYGPWPLLLQLLQKPAVGPRHAQALLKRGRGSTLAAVRQLTRRQLDLPHGRQGRR